MQRNDLLFLALITALAAIASAPPLPAPSARWIVAGDAPNDGSEQRVDLSLQLSLAAIP